MNTNQIKNEEIEHARSIIDTYSEQMAEERSIKIDNAFWLVIKKKPKWMPSFLYKKVIKDIITIKQII